MEGNAEMGQSRLKIKDLLLKMAENRSKILETLTGNDEEVEEETPLTLQDLLLANGNLLFLSERVDGELEIFNDILIDLKTQMASLFKDMDEEDVSIFSEEYGGTKSVISKLLEATEVIQQFEDWCSQARDVQMQYHLNREQIKESIDFNSLQESPMVFLTSDLFHAMKLLDKKMEIKLKSIVPSLPLHYHILMEVIDDLISNIEEAPKSDQLSMYN